MEHEPGSPRRVPETISTATSVAVIAAVMVTSFVLAYRITSGTWPTADWVEAFGTWFGGIATAAAVLWSVRQFSAEQKSRDDAVIDRERQRWQRLSHRAEAVEFSIRILSWESVTGGRIVNHLAIDVKNRDPEPLVDVVVSHPLIGNHLPAFPRIDPYDTTASRSFVVLDSLAQTTLGKDEVDLNLEAELDYSFWLAGVCWIYRSHDRVLLTAEDRYGH